MKSAGYHFYILNPDGTHSVFNRCVDDTTNWIFDVVSLDSAIRAIDYLNQIETINEGNEDFLWGIIQTMRMQNMKNTYSEKMKS